MALSAIFGKPDYPSGQPTTNPATGSVDMGIPANPYANGISVAGTGAGGAATNWGVQWDPTMNSYAANTGFGMAPIYTANQWNQLTSNRSGGQNPMSPLMSMLGPNSGFQGTINAPTAAGGFGGYSLNPGSPFSIATPGGGSQSVQYKLDPATGYYIPSKATSVGSGASPMDQIIQYGALAGAALPLAAGVGAMAGLGTGAGGSLFGVPVTAGPGATALGGSADLGTAVGAAGGAGAGTGGALTYNSVPGQWGGQAGAPIAGEPTAGSLPPGMAGGGTPVAGDISNLNPMAGWGTAPGGGPLDSLGTGAASGTTAGLFSPSLSGLFTPGGPNSLLNTGSLTSLLGGVLGMNKSRGLSGQLTAPYNNAQGALNPAISNLQQLMNPNNFYNSQVGQNLMATKIRDLNAKAAMAGRFGVGAGGTVPSSGAGVDTANLLNQYMAQQWQGALQAATGAAGPGVSLTNASLPLYAGGNVVGANDLNSLFTMLQNQGLQNAGNSALSYLFGGG